MASKIIKAFAVPGYLPDLSPRKAGEQEFG